MYARQVDGTALTLEASGKLYKDALVMYDRQTQTLWTQLDGSAMRGPLVGKKLQPIPSVQTTWKEWKRLHPETLVLRKPSKIRNSPYADYSVDPHAFGISGHQRPDKRLPGKALVVGLREGTDALAVPLQRLKKKRLLETQLGGEPILVVYDERRKTARVFRRRRGEQVLNFQVAERKPQLILRDGQSGNRWEAVTGKAVSGPAAGAVLEPLPHMVSYWWAWVAYSPQTRVEPSK